LNGERSIKIAPMIRIGYEILSRNFHMCILMGLQKQIFFIIFQENQYLSRK
jgi:hypothetical protein